MRFIFLLTTLLFNYAFGESIKINNITPLDILLLRTKYNLNVNLNGDILNHEKYKKVVNIDENKLYILDNEDKNTFINLDRNSVSFDNNDCLNIKIYYFSHNTYDEFLDIIKKNKNKCLSFELSDNPGGILTSSILIGSLFYKYDEPMFYFLNNDNQYKLIKNKFTDIDLTKRYKFVNIKVNHNTGSSAELLTLLLKQKKYSVYGEKTYGKNTVQNIYSDNNSNFYNSDNILKFIGLKGENIYKLGIMPDNIK